MFKHTIIALTALGAGLAGFTASASAFPVQSAPTVETGSSTLLTDVRSRYERNRVTTYDRRYNGKYDRRYHGMRCGNWSNNCRYRHGGYYYQNQWWLFPMVGAGIALGAAAANDGYYGGGGYGNRHVAWCMDRYRSYNPRTNTWVSYSGRVYQCISPYA